MSLATSVRAAHFGSILGIAGLGGTWRVAHRVWGVTPWVGEALMAIATLAWAVLLLLYVGKWLLARQAARAELRHPVDASFIGLLGVATMLVAGAVQPYSHAIGLVLFGVGTVFALGFGVWQTGSAWQAERDHGATTGSLYLPTVAASFVTGTIGASFGFVDWAEFAFGAGVFSWLAIESVLMVRLYGPALPPAQRPSLGIQFAPGAVGGVTYLSITSGPPDLFLHMLVGYSLLQALVILRMTRWIRAQPFGAGYWAYTFGAASLATTLLRMVERGDGGAAATLAPVGVAAASGLIGAVMLGSAMLGWRGLRAAARRDPRLGKGGSPAAGG